jgi:hypothetical protein
MSAVAAATEEDQGGKQNPDPGRVVVEGVTQTVIHGEPPQK